MSTKRTGVFILLTAVYWVVASMAYGQVPPGDCQSMASVWGNVSLADTDPPDVRLWSFTSGDVVTLSVQLTSGTSASVSIVGSDTGSPVYAGPVDAGPFGSPNSATFSPPAGTISLGYFVNAASGLGLLSLTCTSAPVSDTIAGIPATSPWTSVALALVIGMLGTAILRKRR